MSRGLFLFCGLCYTVGMDDMDDYIEPGSPDDPFAELPRLGQLLRHYRHRAGLSQLQLARESGVDESGISMIEAGKTANPWDGTLDRLAVILSQHLLYVTAQEIADRLKEAKRHQPSEYVVHPGLILINDRLNTLPRKLARIAIETFNHILDALEKSHGL